MISRFFRNKFLLNNLSSSQDGDAEVFFQEEHSFSNDIHNSNNSAVYTTHSSSSSSSNSRGCVQHLCHHGVHLRAIHQQLQHHTGLRGVFIRLQLRSKPLHNKRMHTSFCLSITPLRGVSRRLRGPHRLRQLQWY